VAKPVTAHRRELAAQCGPQPQYGVAATRDASTARDSSERDPPDTALQRRLRHLQIASAGDNDALVAPAHIPVLERLANDTARPPPRDRKLFLSSTVSPGRGAANMFADGLGAQSALHADVERKAFLAWPSKRNVSALHGKLERFTSRRSTERKSSGVELDDVRREAQSYCGRRAARRRLFRRIRSGPKRARAPRSNRERVGAASPSPSRRLPRSTQGARRRGLDHVACWRNVCAPA